MLCVLVISVVMDKDIRESDRISIQSRNEDSFLIRNLKDLGKISFWQEVLAEYVGTLLLCLYTIGASCRRPDDPPAGFLEIVLSATFFLPAIITTLAHVSGAHVNPAISIGFLCGKRISFIKFIFFVLAQCLSSVTAVLVLRVLLPEDMQGNLGLILPGPGVTPAQATICEFIIAFLLLFGTSSFIDETRDPPVGNLGGLYVGLIVGTNILFAGSISGGCMNPARNFGPAVMAGNMDLQWIYWLGPMTGGALGTFMYTVVLNTSRTDQFNSCCSSRCRGKQIVSGPERESMI